MISLFLANNKLEFRVMINYYIKISEILKY